MAHKTFISYKYSEARELRDRIIEEMGEDAQYYKGETSESPDLGDLKTESIKNILADMIYDSSVTIVIISPNMKKSNWIDWEVKYSLKEVTRNGRQSHINGIVGVIMKVNGGYDWFIKNEINFDGCKAKSYIDDFTLDIINKNRFNQTPVKYACERCKTVNALTGSYISFVTEDEFLSNPNKYIENAYQKSLDCDEYKIVKQ